jgi:hypothetical protein
MDTPAIAPKYRFIRERLGFTRYTTTLGADDGRIGIPVDYIVSIVPSIYIRLTSVRTNQPQPECLLFAMISQNSLIHHLNAFTKHHPYVPILLAVCSVLVTLKWLVPEKPKLPLPPGPKPKPLIGNLLDMPPSHMWLKLTEWKKVYGVFISGSKGVSRETNHMHSFLKAT